jgi:hypothetical protein
LALVFVVPVSAAPPVVVTGEFDETWPSELCPGITVMDRGVGTYRDTTYFDPEGKPVRFHSHWSGYDEFWNPERPDFVLRGTYTLHYTEDYVTGEKKYNGSCYSITLPGSGKVLKTAGTFYPVTGRWTGIDTTRDPEAMAAFCALFATD